MSCCGLGAEQEQDLCGHCRAAPKWARRRVAGGNFSRPPAPPPTHLPARPGPHRSRASRAPLRPTCGAHLPVHSAAFLMLTAQNARNLACRAPAAMSPERRPAAAHGFVLCSAPRPDPGDGTLFGDQSRNRVLDSQINSWPPEPPQTHRNGLNRDLVWGVARPPVDFARFVLCSTPRLDPGDGTLFGDQSRNRVRLVNVDPQIN